MGRLLAQDGVELVPEQTYRWFVYLSRDHLTRGAVRRVALDASVEAELAGAEPGARGRILVSAGLWYDALDFISRAIEHEPADARLRGWRADLLEQVGLAGAAGPDRAAAEGSADR